LYRRTVLALRSYGHQNSAPTHDTCGGSLVGAYRRISNNPSTVNVSPLTNHTSVQSHSLPLTGRFPNAKKSADSIKRWQRLCHRNTAQSLSYSPSRCAVLWRPSKGNCPHRFADFSRYTMLSSEFLRRRNQLLVAVVKDLGFIRNWGRD
jgi:hypothetical protein